MKKENVLKFELTKDHHKLLRQMYVGWQSDEYGAPEIDPKRPYGNSDVEGDVMEILGLKPTKEHRALAKKLHSEMQDALQIMLQHGEIPLGKYMKETYDSYWTTAE